jgi:glutathione synthase/RimK-type ligase-like ATP-grasp enzyme
MTKIAILVSANMLPGADGARVDAFELTEEMGKIIPAFATQGLTAEIVLWKEAAARAGDYAAMLPLIVWDYFEGDNLSLFLNEMAEASKKTKIFNSLNMLKWNSNKTYLDELQQKGAPGIPTMTVDRVTSEYIAEAFEKFGSQKLVIKPQIGGGAWRQVLLSKGDAYPSTDSLPPAAAILQPFLPSVQSEGEYSFLYFGGHFSHALLKTAAKGDYRIQSAYGGKGVAYSPTPGEFETVEHILDSLGFEPLYARVDLLRGLDGELKLIELEMIEPYLYLSFADGEGEENRGALMLARALKKRLEWS